MGWVSGLLRHGRGGSTARAKCNIKSSIGDLMNIKCSHRWRGLRYRQLGGRHSRRQSPDTAHSRFQKSIDVNAVRLGLIALT